MNATPNAYVLTVGPDTLALVTRALPKRIGIGATPGRLEAEKAVLDRAFGPEHVNFARMHSPVAEGALPPLMHEWWPSLAAFAASAGITM